MNTDYSSLVKTDRAGAEAAAEVLRKAFHEYELLRYYFPDPEKRKKPEKYFTVYQVYNGIKYGEVYASSENMEGVAVWRLSEDYPQGFFNMVRSVPFRVLCGLLTSGFEKMRGVGDFLDESHHRLVPFPHMYLQVIGVAPEHQGKGFAGKLIRAMFERLDTENKPCYLETLEEKNASLYEHLGFRLLERAAIPGTELTNWAMLREPLNR